MNERIIELAKKAGIKKGKSFVYTTYIELEGHSFSQESLEKFAELIVRDVVKTVKRTQITSPDFEWVILNNYDLEIEE